MKTASPFSIVLLGVWVWVHLIGFAIASLFCAALMSLGFDEMHTDGTAMDRFPPGELTRDAVVRNIIGATLRWIWIVPVGAATVGFTTDVLWEHLGATGKRIALFLALTCALSLLGAMLWAGVRCFVRYAPV